MRMGKLTRVALAAAVACAVAFGAAGCSGQSQTQGKASEFKPTLDTSKELTLNVAGVYGNFEALDAVAVAFQEYYPNIQIEYSSMSNFTSDLKNRLSEDTGTDLIAHNWLNPYDKNQDFLFDALEDLSTVDIDFSDIDPNALEYGTINGKQYALPIFMETQGIAVNTDILEKHGIAIPQSYDELLACCESLRKAGYETPVLTYESRIARCFIPYTYELMNKGDDIETAFRKTTERTEAFATSGYIHPDSKTLADSYDSMIMRYLEGDIPIMTIPATDISGALKRQLKSDAYKANPFNYTFVPFPGTDEENTAYMERLSILAIGVNKNSENLDYANELMRFMATDKAMDIFAEKKGSPTPTESGFNRFPNLRDANKVYLNKYTIAVEDVIKQSCMEYHFDDKDQGKMYETLDEYLVKYNLKKQ